MRTITYSIREWTDEETGHGHGFTVIESETLHVVTGDETREYDVPGWFETAEAAQAFIAGLLAANELVVIQTYEG